MREHLRAFAAPTFGETYLSGETRAINAAKERLEQDMKAKTAELEYLLERTRKVAAILPSLEYTLNQLGLQLDGVDSPDARNSQSLQYARGASSSS